VAGLLVAGLRPGATTLPLTATGLLVVGVGALLLRRSRAAARARTRRAVVIEACDALAAGLRAGQPPERVLDRVAADILELRSAAAASRLGGDVPAALRAAARRDGAEGLSLVAAAWTVAQRSGAGLADVVTRIAGSVRAEAEQRRQVEVALGTSRATARLLAGLPLMGVALGTGIDADPLHVLFGSAVGAWCLLLGTALAAVGLLWVERLADGARQ
jgi:tight adherence protein B